MERRSAKSYKRYQCSQKFYETWCTQKRCEETREVAIDNNSKVLVRVNTLNDRRIQEKRRYRGQERLTLIGKQHVFCFLSVNFRRCDWIQSLIVLMSNCMVVKSELDENVDDKRMSLPSRISLVEKEISLMYKLNRSGPRINPWGTP